MSAIGGPFDYHIPDFKGFKQEQSQWCWAAVTKTTFYWMTGAELEQAELARIQMGGDATQMRDMMKDLRGFDPVDCLGAAASTARCNHPGTAGVALGYLGKGFPSDRYPDVGDYAGLLHDLRESLSQRVPAAIQIVWDGDGAHYVNVYGARFAAEPEGTQSSVAVDLSVFDPWDGDLRVISSINYLPPYRQGAGTWVGWVSFGNYEDPDKAVVPPWLCPLLTADARQRFCH